MTIDAGFAPDLLRHAGFGDSDISDWIATMRSDTADYDLDVRSYSPVWQRSYELLARLPPKPARNPDEAQAAAAILAVARDHRERFLAAHVEAVYDRVTEKRSRFMRVEDIVFEVAAAVPGLAPTPKQVAVEHGRALRDKDGLEIDQGLFLAHALAGERAGRHLCHAMLLPRPESAELLAKFAREGTLDLGTSILRRSGPAVHLIMKNPRYLNAEDQTTLDASEIAVDIATLDSQSHIAVLRGGEVEHPKYRGRHVFGSGINLTHLYRGQIPFVRFLQRDLAFVHKFLRGVARPDALPDDVHGTGIEKPWIAAVEGFAIGGHCQILLTMDYVLAASDAYLTLPARKEGIIPGLANLRLPRFVGDRLARQAIQYERRIDCDSDAGRLICDEIVPPADVGSAIERVVDGLTSSGTVSAVGNRRALRIGQEPLDLFRKYCSAYARDQAYCHFSPALIANLERNWDAKNRTG